MLRRSILVLPKSAPLGRVDGADQQQLIGGESESGGNGGVVVASGDDDRLAHQDDIVFLYKYANSQAVERGCGAALAWPSCCGAALAGCC